MNEYTLFQNLQTELLAETWTAGSAVFPTGSVLIVPDVALGFRDALNTGLRTPFCLIAPANADSDPDFGEEPDFIRFRVACLIATVVPGGALGQETIMGANIQDSTKSEGKGILQVAQEFYNAVGKLNALEGITLQVRQTDEQGGVYGPNNTYTAYRIYSLEMWGTAT